MLQQWTVLFLDCPYKSMAEWNFKFSQQVNSEVFTLFSESRAKSVTDQLYPNNSETSIIGPSEGCMVCPLVCFVDFCPFRDRGLADSGSYTI